MSEIVDRAARMIARHTYGGGVPGVSLEADEWGRCVAAARAVLEAIKEPTEAMGLAVISEDCEIWECFRSDGATWTPADVYRAMIEAALKPEACP